jgi:hypothetical protein
MKGLDIHGTQSAFIVLKHVGYRMLVHPEGASCNGRVTSRRDWFMHHVLFAVRKAFNIVISVSIHGFNLGKRGHLEDAKHPQGKRNPFTYVYHKGMSLKADEGNFGIGVIVTLSEATNRSCGDLRNHQQTLRRLRGRESAS